MNIIIKGMEMPKTGEYRCVIRKWREGITIDLYGEEELCGTLLPVPPHGRLIDADALLDNLMQQMRRKNYDEKWVLILAGVMNTIDAAPTFIEAEGENDENDKP